MWRFSRHCRERELQEEIRSHMHMAVQDRVARGETREQAERAVRREFGNELRVKEVTRMMWGGVRLDRALRDLRHAMHGLRRSPGFTIAVVLSLALGIGATTTVFTFTDAILLRPLPFPEADRLVALRHEAPGLQVLDVEQSDGTYLHYRAHSRTLSDIATYYENVVNLSGADGVEAERVPVAMVSASFFDVLGAHTVLGRLPTEAELRGDAGDDDPYVRGATDGGQDVLLSHDLWRRRFGSDPDIVGTFIEANRAPKRVIGILEPGFGFPRDVAIWYPEEPDAATAQVFDMYKHGVGRLAQGSTADDAERELARLLVSLPDAYPEMTPELLERTQLRAVVTPLKDLVVGDARLALWLLFGCMAFLLLAVSANVATLVLLRREEKDRDVAVRWAMGGGRVDVLRLFAAESAIVVALGGVLGLLAAWAGVASLVALVPPGTLPRLDEVALGAGEIAMAAVLSLALGAMLAVLPAWRGAGRSPYEALREGAVTSTTSSSRRRAQQALVTVQLALASSLLVGAALMTRSADRLRHAELGFDPDGVLTATIAIPYAGYETYDRAQRFWNELTGRVSRLPGVERAASVTGLPLVPEPIYYDLAIDVEERPGEPFAGVTVYFATPTYFETLGIRTIRGSTRYADREVERPVAISEAAARKLFGETGAVGKRIRRTAGPGAWMTVAAVVGDVPARTVGGEPATVVYLPMLREPVDPGRIPGTGALVLRATVAPTSLAASVRALVRSVDPDLPLTDVRTMGAIVSASTARTTFTLLLLTVASLASLFLGLVGVYGVTAYALGRRTREIGLRVALGASAADIQRMVLVETARLVLAGAGMGALAAFGLTHFMSSLLFEIGPADPASFAVAIPSLAIVAMLAAWVPARRAAALDPRRALSSG